MNYNEKEIGLISDATACASTAIDTAYALMRVLYEKYLEDKDGIRSLAFDAQNRIDILEGQLRGIYSMICETKRELDVFSFSESYLLNRDIEIALEKQEIIDLKKKMIA